MRYTQLPTYSYTPTYVGNPYPTEMLLAAGQQLQKKADVLDETLGKLQFNTKYGIGTEVIAGQADADYTKQVAALRQKVMTNPNTPGIAGEIVGIQTKYNNDWRVRKATEDFEYKPVATKSFIEVSQDKTADNGFIDPNTGKVIQITSPDVDIPSYYGFQPTGNRFAEYKPQFDTVMHSLTETYKKMGLETRFNASGEPVIYDPVMKTTVLARDEPMYKAAIERGVTEQDVKAPWATSVKHEKATRKRQGLPELTLPELHESLLPLTAWYWNKKITTDIDNTKVADGSGGAEPKLTYTLGQPWSMGENTQVDKGTQLGKVTVTPRNSIDLAKNLEATTPDAAWLDFMNNAGTGKTYTIDDYNKVAGSTDPMTLGISKDLSKDLSRHMETEATKNNNLQAVNDNVEAIVTKAYPNIALNNPTQVNMAQIAQADKNTGVYKVGSELQATLDKFPGHARSWEKDAPEQLKPLRESYEKASAEITEKYTKLNPGILGVRTISTSENAEKKALTEQYLNDFNDVIRTTDKWTNSLIKTNGDYGKAYKLRNDEIAKIYKDEDAGRNIVLAERFGIPGKGAPADWKPVGTNIKNLVEANPENYRSKVYDHRGKIITDVSELMDTDDDTGQITLKGDLMGHSIIEDPQNDKFLLKVSRTIVVDKNNPTTKQYYIDVTPLVTDAVIDGQLDPNTLTDFQLKGLFWDEIKDVPVNTPKTLEDVGTLAKEIYGEGSPAYQIFNQAISNTKIEKLPNGHFKVKSGNLPEKDETASGVLGTILQFVQQAEKSAAQGGTATSVGKPPVGTRLDP